MESDVFLRVLRVLGKESASGITRAHSSQETRSLVIQHRTSSRHVRYEAQTTPAIKFTSTCLLAGVVGRGPLRGAVRALYGQNQLAVSTAVTCIIVTSLILATWNGSLQSPAG